MTNNSNCSRKPRRPTFRAWCFGISAWCLVVSVGAYAAGFVGSAGISAAYAAGLLVVGLLHEADSSYTSSAADDQTGGRHDA